MSIEEFAAWLFIGIAYVAGLGLLFAHIDAEQLRQESHSLPGLALFRFPFYRYGAASVCFALAVSPIWRGCASVRCHTSMSNMIKTAALGIDVIILFAAGSYFVMVGFCRNTVLDIFLGLMGAASFIIWVGSIVEARRKNGTEHNDVIYGS